MLVKEQFEFFSLRCIQNLIRPLIVVIQCESGQLADRIIQT